jgi:NADH-quinone oxidoreductase subunit A
LLSDYVPILVLLGLATAFVVASLVVASLVGPKNPTARKSAPYECGIEVERLPVGDRFPVRWYVTAMLFIVFDIETIFFYPWAVVFRRLGAFALAEMGLFVVTLFVAYVYVLRRGGLDWD